MKKTFLLILFTIIVFSLNSQVTIKTKGFEEKLYKVNANYSMDSLETILLSSYLGTSNEFLAKLDVDSLPISKKIELNEGTYIFVSQYDDAKSIRAPYSNSFIDYRFSSVYKKMIFIVKITALAEKEFTIQYGKDKLYFETE